ncbi:sensor histidine kinase [Butyrivibrio sp. X503]|uniref:ATP-binding protein n=1 Tax=Butyrivibrio sp. X503 TaxID=2364878 RepID=UPI000EA8B7BE|nr:ATP-binding protein [Butyrivibrio sp. X503]RKM58167.1 sensor histidine kinase [Butyrivibrio sp. X503]
MAISVLLLIICAMVLIFVVPHSRYGLPMFFMIVGIILTTISVLFQYYSSSSYVPPAYFPLRGFDIFLYRSVGHSFKLPMKYMQLVRNFGVVIYLLGISTLIDVIRRNVKQGGADTSVAAFLKSKIIFAAISISYLCFYSTKNAFFAYLKYHDLSEPSRHRLQLLYNFAHTSFSILIAVYMFYPLIFFFINLIKKKMTCFFGTTIILFSSVSLINLCFYHFIFVGLFKNSPKYVFKTGFWYFNKVSRIPPIYINIYPIFALGILIFIMISINGFFSLDLISYSRNRVLKRKIDDLNYNLKDVFHSEKNLIFSMNILANEALSSYGSDEGKEKLERIVAISNKQMKALSDSLGAIKQLHIKPNAVDIRTITDEAIEQARIPADITVEKKYCDFPVLCTLDKYHTLHAISNLIINSVDSLSMMGSVGSGSEIKKLIITIEASEEWVYWSLWDNGTGIAPRSVRKLMMPFASTKSKNSNWGIGLPYAFKVITSQLGQMHITGSKKKNCHHALVEILLPRRKQENG